MNLKFRFPWAISAVTLDDKALQLNRGFGLGFDCVDSFSGGELLCSGGVLCLPWQDAENATGYAILGGAALQRCDNNLGFNVGFSR